MPTRGRRRRRRSRAMMVGRDVALALRGVGASAGRAAAESRAPSATSPLLEVRDLTVAGARRADAVDGVSLRDRARRDPRHRRRRGQRADRAHRGDRRPARASTSAAIALGGARRHARSACASAATPGSRTSPRTATSAAWSSTTRRRQPDPRPAASTSRGAACSTRERIARNARAADRGVRHPAAGPDAAGARAVGRQPAEDRDRARDGRATSRCCSPRSRRAASTSAPSSSFTRSCASARDAGKAVLLVSADLAEVLALSDRIAVMYGGRIVAVAAARRGDAQTCSART